MSIQDVSSKGKEQIQGYAGRKQPAHSEGFQESLMQNLKAQGQESTVAAAERTSQNVGVAGKPPRVRVNALTNRVAVQNVEVRHMSYEESDHIEIAVTEGYTLKGKKEGHRVYVEAKYEDGRFEAYHVDTDKVSGQTGHRIEQFALETIDHMMG